MLDAAIAVFAADLQRKVDRIEEQLWGPFDKHRRKLVNNPQAYPRAQQDWVDDAQKSINASRQWLDKIKHKGPKETMKKKIDDAQETLNNIKRDKGL